MPGAALPQHPARLLGAAELSREFRACFPAQRFIVASNREPYEHQWDEASDAIVVRRPAGGLVAALDPLMQAVGGIWIAWGSGDRDEEVVDARQQLRVPPEDPHYTLHRLWLTQQDVHQYYHGYANQLLWPLCHLRPALTRTRAKYWERYVAVNTRFADAVVENVPPDGSAAVWVQDYHLALVPRLVRARRADLTIAHFWHIPFPPPEIFRIASHADALLRGLLANDVMGFHLPLYCDNFLRCTELVLPDAQVDRTQRSATVDGHTCYVRAFPISIDIDGLRAAAQAPAATQVERLRARFAPAGAMIGLGVDRIDYSKGLEEKLKALDLFFTTHPEFRERFSFVQIAVPSRTGIESYDFLNEKLERMVWAINDRYGTDTWNPVHFLRDSLPLKRLALFYRAADVCLVTSLQDGMNLVAKEFVAAQVDDPGGVLVLSRFAGAAEELDGAVEVNPYDPEAMAVALHAALLMPAAERRERMQRLQRSLRTIYDWMAEIFRVWGVASAGEPAPLTVADRWSQQR